MEHREIRCRAWILSKRKMYNNICGVVDYSEIAGEIEIWWKAGEGLSHLRFDKMDCIVQWWTGLCDADGDEIYKDDVIILADGIIPYRVRWNEDAAGFYYEELDWRKDQHAWPFDCDRAFGCHIHGNVFENPELLEKV